MQTKRIAIVAFLTGLVLWLYVLGSSSSGDSAAVTVRQASDSIAIEPDSTHEKEQRSIDKQCININTANAAQLEALPGIGPVIAGRIINYRNANGPFLKLSDVDQVKGIGPAKLKKLANLICFE